MALETNIHGIWGAKQAAKGTPATAPTTATTGKHLRLAAQGDIATQIGQGSEQFSDLGLFGDAQDFVTTIIGQGAPPIHGTPDELAWLIWLFNSQETVTDITGPPAKKKHVSTPTPSLSWATFYKRTGSSIIDRKRYSDSVISQLEISAGTGQHILRAVPTIISLESGEQIAADPTLVLPTTKAFLWTEVDGALKLNGGVIKGPTQYTITLNRNLEPIYADSPRPHDLQPGTPSLGVSVAMVLDQDAFDLANLLLYGTATPAAGDKPTPHIGALGALDLTHTQKDDSGAVTGNSAQFEVPGVRWQKPGAVAVPNPGGGGGTLELTGSMRRVAGQPEWRSTVICDQAAFTA